MSTNNGTRSQKIQEVIEYLQNALYPLTTGEKLPGYRTIMQDTGTGRKTISHALDILTKEGVLKVDPKRGIFRTKPMGENDEIRLLHWYPYSISPNSFLGLLLNSLIDFAATDNRNITIENVSNRTPENVAQELLDHGISNCIIYGASSPIFAQYLNTKMSFCMELLPRHSANNIISLRDCPDMTVIQFNYLRNLGYTKIGYIHFYISDVSLYPVQIMRLLDYYRLMAENHLQVNPNWVFHCTSNYENIEDGFKQIIYSNPKPEVLLVPGSALRYIYPLCRKYGIKIGKDLAIFSCDDPNENFNPEATMITNNPKNISQKCWQIFRDLYNGKDVSSCYTDLHIRIGQTVPSLN